MSALRIGLGLILTKSLQCARAGYQSCFWMFASVARHFIILSLRLCALTVGFGRVVAVLADQVLRPVVVLAREVRL